MNRNPDAEEPVSSYTSASGSLTAAEQIPSRMTTSSDETVSLPSDETTASAPSNVDRFPCFVVDCSTGKRLKSRRALKRHLRDVHDIKIPAEIYGVTVTYGPGDCIFPDCRFPTENVDDYRKHLDHEHSLMCDEPTTTDNADSALEAWDDVNMDEAFFKRFDTAFLKMTHDEKWTLSTGKVVEDEMFKLGKKCKFEHPCHSWILDTTDENYTLHGHFTKEELKEINDYKPVIFPDIPDDVANYLKTLNATTIDELRQQCLKCPWSEPFNRDKDFDVDWVFVTMLMMIREYESGNLETSHHEQWYMLRIWGMVDRMFDNIPGLETVRGESASISTAMRKNENRIISSITKMKRKVMGRRGDLLLQIGTAEYGCAEAGGKYEGAKGSKRMMEGGMKAPKMLKDMINNLAYICQNEEDRVVKLRTVGYIHSALSMEILVMDAPNGYVARLTRSKQYDVPRQVSNINRQLLPLLSVLLSTKLLIKEIIDVVENRSNDIEAPPIELKNAFQRQITPDRTEIKRKLLPSCNHTPVKKRSKEAYNDRLYPVHY